MTPIRRAAFAYIAFFAAIGAGFPYLPVYYRSLGLGLGEIGLLTALSSAVQLVGAPAWGSIADRFPRSRLSLGLASLVAAGGAGLIGAADGMGPTVVAGAVLLAFGIAGISPVLDSRTLEILGPDRIRYGQLRAWGSLSFVVVAMMVGALIDRSGIHALFGVYIPAYVVTSLVALSLPRTGVRHGAGAFRGSVKLLRSREMLVFLGAVFLVFTALNGVTWFYSIALVTLGGSGSEVGLVWAVGALIEVPIMFLFPRLAKRFGTGPLLVVGAALFALRAVLSALATEPWHLIAISPVEGVGYGLFFVGAVDYVARRAPHGLAATAQGLFSATNGLSAILGSAAGGAIAAATSLQGLFALCGVIGVAGTVAVVLVLRDAPRAVPTDEVPLEGPPLPESPPA